jgi:hypothetical protein
MRVRGMLRNRANSAYCLGCDSRGVVLSLVGRINDALSEYDQIFGFQMLREWVVACFRVRLEEHSDI